MLKEIVIFIGIFIISIAIYFLYSPSKSGLTSFPTNIGFGFVIGLIGFFIAVLFIAVPGRGKKKVEEQVSPLEEVNSLLDEASNLYSEIRLRLRDLHELGERKPYEDASKQIKNLQHYLRQARERISLGKVYDGIVLLAQAESIIRENPYATAFKTKLNNFRGKLREMYTLKTIREREQRA